jgi:hypothetical protein
VDNHANRYDAAVEIPHDLMHADHRAAPDQSRIRLAQPSDRLRPTAGSGSHEPHRASYAAALPAVRSVDVRVHDRQHRVDVRFSRMTRMLACSVRLMKDSLVEMLTLPVWRLFTQGINAPSGIAECSEREGRRGG